LCVSGVGVIELLHRIVAISWVYDLVQFATGQTYTHHRIAKHLKTLAKDQHVLDIGAGTGLYRGLWSSDYKYVCCDIDMDKLSGFTRKFDDPALQGDGTRLPFKSASLDIVVCIAVAHHLDDAQFDQLLSESARVLKTGGILLFLEPVFAEKRLPGRLLWMLDRGSNPRTPETLETMLRQHFTIRHVEHYAVYHRYLFATFTK
jgi:ubiquinone/menaquinone biosynthesis C-methylase UbiE